MLTLNFITRIQSDVLNKKNCTYYACIKNVRVYEGNAIVSTDKLLKQFILNP